MSCDECLVSRVCVAWRTDRPYPRRLRVSPSFIFQDSSWKLQIVFSEKREYYILLVRQESRKRFRSFDVTTSLESVTDKIDGPMLSQTTAVLHTPLRIWSAQEAAVLENMPELTDYGEFTIVCTFRIVNSYSKEDNKPMSSSVPSEINFHDEASAESLSCDILKLMESHVFPDVKLKSEERVFPAHRAVLAGRSEVFDAMFRNNMTESETGIVDIEDVEAPVLDVFLKYLYSGKLPDISEDTVRSLYVVSDKYAVPALKTACCQLMAKGLTVENCLDFLTLAGTYGDRAFKERVMTFISNNLSILQSDAWLKFSEGESNLAIEIYRKCFEKKESEKVQTANSVCGGTALPLYLGVCETLKPKKGYRFKESQDS